MGIFLIFSVVACVVYSSNENGGIESLLVDFSKWTRNGFCCYSESYDKIIHLPNGHTLSLYSLFSENDPELVCVSKDELILSFRKFKPDGNDIEKYNWDLTNRELLWSIEDDDYYCQDLQDGTIDFYRYDGEDTTVRYNADFQNGIIKTISPDDDNSKRKEKTYFKFSDENDEYSILKDNDEIVISHSKLDSEVLALFNKWNFVPSISRVFDNGTIWMAFHRKVSWLGGQKATMLVSYDYNNSEVNGYQFLFEEYTDYKNHKMYPILDEIKSEITIINS